MSTAGGFETWMQYVDGFKLRHFCGFELLNDARGLSCLKDYHRKVVEDAVANGFGMINEGLHYRASRDWGELVGFSREAIKEINVRGIEFYRDFAREYASPDTPMLVGGVIGPRGDAYNVGRIPDAAEAEDYHSEQILTFRDAGADHVTAMMFSSVEEAIGLARAAWTSSCRTSHGSRRCYACSRADTRSRCGCTPRIRAGNSSRAPAC
jgi:homocysteine S-methyltransferase